MKEFQEIVLVKEVVQPVLIILISFIIYRLIAKILKNISKRPTKKMNRKKRNTLIMAARNFMKWSIVVIDIIMILNVYGINTKAILASLSVIGAVVGLAMQDLLKDIITGLSILFEDQFRVGDWIQVSGFKGEVIALGLKTTKIRAYEGQVKIISNRLLTEVINFNMENSLAIVDVAVSYDSDLRKVERVLSALCIDEQEKIPSLKGKIELLGVQELANSGIVYRIVANCKSMEQFGVERQLRKAIKVAFDKHNITIPYPQVVVHDERI